MFCPDYGFIEKVARAPKNIQPLFDEKLARIKFFAAPCELDKAGDEGGVEMRFGDGDVVRLVVLGEGDWVGALVREVNAGGEVC